MTWDERLAEIAGNMKVVWGTVSAIGLGLVATVAYFQTNFTPSEELEDKLEVVASLQESCVRFPTQEELRRLRAKHTVTDGRPGDEAIVTWYGIERLRDCGAPCITPWIRNGDGVPRVVKAISIETLARGPCRRGARLSKGVQPPFPYAFRIPKEATAGCGVFYIELKFDENPEVVQSPWLPFTILNDDGSKPDTSGEDCV